MFEVEAVGCLVLPWFLVLSGVECLAARFAGVVLGFMLDGCVVDMSNANGERETRRELPYLRSIGVHADDVGFCFRGFLKWGLLAVE